MHCCCILLFFFNLNNAALSRTSQHFTGQKKTMLNGFQSRNGMELIPDLPPSIYVHRYVRMCVCASV